MDDTRAAAIAKALSHPARMRIVRLLARQTECNGSEVFSELALAQSTISEHLRVLKESGLVKASPAGTGMTYCLVPTVLDEFIGAMGGIAVIASNGCLGSTRC